MTTSGESTVVAQSTAAITRTEAKTASSIAVKTYMTPIVTNMRLTRGVYLSGFLAALGL